LNRQLPVPQRLARQADTVLVGIGGPLDSLGIVNFVHTLEQKVEEAAGRPVTLLDADLLAADGPFRTVEALSVFLATVTR